MDINIYMLHIYSSIRDIYFMMYLCTYPYTCSSNVYIIEFQNYVCMYVCILRGM